MIPSYKLTGKTQPFFLISVLCDTIVWERKKEKKKKTVHPPSKVSAI